jgi:DNA-binding PadR family transcriptional regulator
MSTVTRSKYEIETSILFEFQEGPQHLYDLQKKTKISTSTLYKYLPLLEKAGYLQDKPAKKKCRGRIDYALTLKGFIRLLSDLKHERGYKKDRIPSMRELVKTYGQHFQYPVEQRVTEIFKEENPPIDKTGKMPWMNQPATITRWVDSLKSIFPLYYYEDLKGSLGEERYFEGLGQAASRAESKIKMTDRFMSSLRRTEQGKDQMDSSDFDFRVLGHEFEFGFLRYALESGSFLRPIANQALYDEMKKLLAEEIQEGEKNLHRLKLLESPLRSIEPGSAYPPLGKPQWRKRP